MLGRATHCEGSVLKSPTLLGVPHVPSNIVHDDASSLLVTDRYHAAQLRVPMLLPSGFRRDVRFTTTNRINGSITPSEVLTLPPVTSVAIWPV